MKKYILALVLVPVLTASGVPILGTEQEEMTRAITVAPVLAAPLLSFNPVQDDIYFDENEGIHKALSSMLEPRTIGKKSIAVASIVDTPSSPSRVFTVEGNEHGYKRASVPFVKEEEIPDAPARRGAINAEAAEAPAAKPKEGPKTVQESRASTQQIFPLPTWTYPPSK